MGHDRSARAQRLMPLAANAPNSSQKAAREALRTRMSARLHHRAAHTLTWPTAGRSRCCSSAGKSSRDDRQLDWQKALRDDRRWIDDASMTQPVAGRALQPDLTPVNVPSPQGGGR